MVMHQDAPYLAGGAYVEAQKILMICTSVSRLGDTDHPTGAWAESLAAAYYLFQRKGYQISIASVRGGKVPFDPVSLSGQNLTVGVRKLLSDDYALSRFNESLSLVLLDANDYDAIYIADGHGLMWDGPYNSEIKRLVEEAWKSNRLVATVGHGLAALVSAVDLRTCKPLVRNQEVTGTTNTEEASLGRTSLVPFLVETKLRKMGAVFRRGKADHRPIAVRSGNLITGQNGASSELTAATLIEVLSLGVRMLP